MSGLGLTPKNKRYFTALDRAMATAFTYQRSGAKKRGIPWEFTQEEWTLWWLTDDRWSRRGPRKGQLVMCRIGDTGPYHPDNVYAGTTEQNAADVSVERRRAVACSRTDVDYVTGEAHGSAKLTDEQVRQIRTATGTQREIAKQFGVSQRTVGRIVRGHHWKHVTAQPDSSNGPAGIS